MTNKNPNVPKYGTVEYFTLEELSDRLKGWKYDKFALDHLDKLRFEVEILLEASKLAAKEKNLNKKP